MPEDAVGTASGLGHGAKDAAKETFGSLLDVLFGILVPIALFLAGLAMATQIGGYAIIGNNLWTWIGGGQTNLPGGGGGTVAITGPQNGALTGAILLMIWGGVALVLFHASRGMAKWGKWILRSVAAFFGGLAAFALWFVSQSLAGVSASSMVGAGGILDKGMSQLQAAGQKASGG